MAVNCLVFELRHSPNPLRMDNLTSKHPQNNCDKESQTPLTNSENDRVAGLTDTFSLSFAMIISSNLYFVDKILYFLPKDTGNIILFF